MAAFHDEPVALFAPLPYADDRGCRYALRAPYVPTPPHHARHHTRRHPPPQHPPPQHPPPQHHHHFRPPPQHAFPRLPPPPPPHQPCLPLPPPQQYPPYHRVAHTPSPSPRLAEPAPYFVGAWTKDVFIEMTAFMLDTAAQLNNDFVPLPTYSEPESVYFSVSRPDIPTKDYVRRLVTYTRCSPSAFVVMLIYIDRIAVANHNLLVTPFNMHRLLVTALTLACKFLDDRCYSNIHYAKVGGIPTAREMNRLELQYLKYLDYRMHVGFDEFKRKLTSLMNTSHPTSPVSIMLNSSPVTTANTSPASSLSTLPNLPTGTPADRVPMPIDRRLDFDTPYDVVSMVDDSPSVDIAVERNLDPYTRQYPAMQRMKQDKWAHRKPSPQQPPTRRSASKRTSRRDSRMASSVDPWFYRTGHPSSMPMRHAECAP